MSISGIWHFGFTVSDIERAIRFYTEALGLELRHRQIQDNEYTSNLVGYPGVRLNVAQLTLPGGVSSRSGHILELSEYERPRGGRLPDGTNQIASGHLAFEVTDIDALIAPIERLGGRLVGAPQEITEGINQGGRAVYIRDPDGITIELVEPPPASNPPSVAL